MIQKSEGKARKHINYKPTRKIFFSNKFSVIFYGPIGIIENGSVKSENDINEEEEVHEQLELLLE